LPGKVGIILSGLGYEKGTQILEIPFIYREIERLGSAVVNLIPRESAPAAGRGKTYIRRDIFEECAFFARGETIALEEADPKKLTALIIPGGRGALTVLSDIAESGAEARVLRSAQDLIVGMQLRAKPIGTLGYGGAILMIALKRSVDEPILTLGEDAALTAMLSFLGVAPVNVGPQEVIFDPVNRIFSAAGISLNGSIAKGADGVEKLTEAVVQFKEKKTKTSGT
jgi:enhancing lycopene biosynthesis protein 2